GQGETGARRDDGWLSRRLAAHPFGALVAGAADRRAEQRDTGGGARVRWRRADRGRRAGAARGPLRAGGDAGARCGLRLRRYQAVPHVFAKRAAWGAVSTRALRRRLRGADALRAQRLREDPRAARRFALAGDAD